MDIGSLRAALLDGGEPGRGEPAKEAHLGQKILLADDSNVAQRMGKEILSGEGFEVTAVSNGQAALKKLKEYTPDLILADIFMPGATGYELCQFVKSEPLLARIPVLLLVGAMEPYDPEEGRRVRADGVITKPLQSSNLLSLVKQVLETPPRTERPKSASPRTPAKVISIPVNKPAAVEPAPFGEATAAMWPPEPSPASFEKAAVPESDLAAPEPAFFPEMAEAAITPAPEPGWPRRWKWTSTLRPCWMICWVLARTNRNRCEQRRRK